MLCRIALILTVATAEGIEPTMYLRIGIFLLTSAWALGLAGCGGGSEPSEAQMKDAMLEAMNHPPGEKVSDPVTITFFKKEACDNPTPQGFDCTFTVKVASRNIGASMY